MLSVTVKSALGFSDSVSLELARAGNLLVEFHLTYQDYFIFLDLLCPMRHTSPRGCKE